MHQYKKNYQIGTLNVINLKIVRDRLEIENNLIPLIFHENDHFSEISNATIKLSPDNYCSGLNHWIQQI